MPSGQNLKAFRWSATSVTRQLRIWIKLGKSSLKDVPSSGSQYLTLSNIITPGHWGLPRGVWEMTLWPSRFSELICKAAVIFPEYQVCGLPSKHSLTLIIFRQKEKKKVLYINKKLNPLRYGLHPSSTSLPSSWLNHSWSRTTSWTPLSDF